MSVDMLQRQRNAWLFSPSDELPNHHTLFSDYASVSGAHEMTDTYVRLHISPFSPDLFSAIINPSQVASARNTSYHRIQTSPEHGYGFVELPSMAAEKIKQKFNGAILKGAKLKVESARPLKRRRIDTDSDGAKDNEETSAPKVAPRKRTKAGKVDVVQGHEIEAGRKVRRGWTDPDRKSKKSSKPSNQPASKYSEKEELLFRTNPPPNKLEMSTSQIKKKGRRSKDSQIVHEFAKSVTQPSFLRVDGAASKSTDHQYVDGEGWVDREGVVIEPETLQSQRIRLLASAVKPGRTRSKKVPATELESSSSSSESSSSSATSDTSSSGSSDASDEADEADEADKVVEDTSTAADADDGEESDASNTDESVPANVTSEPNAHASTNVPTIIVPGLGNGEESGSKVQSEVHPLEALFKKPPMPATSQDAIKPSLEISTSFSFFDAIDGEDGNEDLVVPMTPFSSQDMRNRGLRSAAPTPDTAHPSRFPSLGSTGYPEDEDMDDGNEYFTKNDLERETSGQTAGKDPDPKISDFEKKFWENRGDNNRAWKNRRRTVLKEKRQRENRARRPKNW